MLLIQISLIGVKSQLLLTTIREGICGSCSMYINGEAHGPGRAITTCQLHMREFKDGETIYIEPWRAKAFQ